MADPPLRTLPAGGGREAGTVAILAGPAVRGVFSRTNVGEKWSFWSAAIHRRFGLRMTGSRDETVFVFRKKKTEGGD
jgi:hypothetical protein